MLNTKTLLLSHHGTAGAMLAEKLALEPDLW